MRLVRLDIAGFGRLQGRIDLGVEPGRVGLVLERNEAGKSTMAEAIVAALYGLDGDRRHFRGTITDVERFQPWQGGPYRLALTLEVGGETLIVERDFERGELRVLSGGHDVSQRYLGGGKDRLGETLTGLSEAQFRASCFAGQGQLMQWREDPKALSQALQRVADSQQGDSTAAGAIAVLQNALDKYQGLTLQSGQVDTEIKRCRQELEAKRAELDALERRRREQAERLDRIAAEEIEDQRTALERMILDLRRLRTELGTQKGMLERDAERREKVAELERRLAEEGDLLTIDPETMRSVVPLQKRQEIVAERVRTLEAEVETLEARIAELTEVLDGHGLTREPTEDDLVECKTLRQAIDDLVTEEERSEKQIEFERGVLRSRGIDVDEALQYAAQFDQLVEGDRRILIGAENRRIQRRERLDDVQRRRANAERELQDLQRRHAGTRRRGWVFVAIAVLSAAVAFALADRIPLPSYLVALAPGLLGAFGVFSLWSGSSGRDPAMAHAQSRVEEADLDLERLANESFEAEREFADLAERLGLAPDQLEARYEQWCRIESTVNALLVHQQRLQEIEARREKLGESAEHFWQIFGDEVDLGLLPEREQDLVAAVRAAKQRHDAQQELDQRRRTLAAERENAERVRVELQTLYAKVGVPADDLEAAATLFEQRRTAAEQLMVLRDEQLPALKADLFDDARRHSYEQKIEAARARIAELEPEVEARLRRENDPALASTLDWPISEDEYREQRDALDGGERSRHEQTRQLHAEVLAFRREYEAQAPQLRTRIADLEAALARAEQFRAAVTLARDTLDTIGRETHRVWATEMGRAANELLVQLGSEVRDLEFGDDLEFTLKRSGRPLAGEAARRTLSEGARDLVSLATRLAMARFLGGGGEPLPLILDDPFANADDERLLVGLRTLVDVVAPGQQVLLLACQESRYEWALAQLGRPDAIEIVALESSTPSGS